MITLLIAALADLAVEVARFLIKRQLEKNGGEK